MGDFAIDEELYRIGYNDTPILLEMFSNPL